MSNDFTFLREQGGNNNYSFLEPPDTETETHTGLVAHAGGGQAAATHLFKGLNVFATVATAGDSAVLPLAGQVGDEITVVNTGAASMDVFPGVGDFINALAVNADLAVAVGAVTVFIRTKVAEGVSTWSSK